MDLDTEIPGAQRFIQFLLHEPRVKIFYVSSRFKETQQTATLKSLKKLGLLRKKRNTDDLLLEPTLFLRNLNQSSIEFKTTAFNAIQNWQTHSDVIAVFENEPENMNAMTSIFSQAEAYFMEGAFLKNEPILPSVHHLQDYL
jgi:predicted secreted acid phosphatase